MINNRVKAALMAFHDPSVVQICDNLTSAVMRRHFIYLAGHEIERAKRGQSLALIFMDLDNLKEVNDKKGHKAGDKYIHDFGFAVEINIRSYDHFGRWGGDEFVLLLPGANISQAEMIIERVEKKFPSFSYGIVEWKQEEDNIEDTIERADALMYQQKKVKKAVVKRPG